MKDIFETSYGIIPLVYQEDKPYVFVVKHSNGFFWGFPKGHAEKGETSPVSVAKRELKEETDLDVLEIYNTPPFKEEYIFLREDGKVHKTVIFFVAQTTLTFHIDHKEILEARWVLLQDVDHHLTYPEAKNIAKSLKKLVL